MGKTLKEIIKEEYLMYKEEIDGAIQKVFDHADFILGEEVEKFEKEFAEYLGVKYVVSCGSGTDALILAIKAITNNWDIRKIGVPKYCFGAVTEAVLWNKIKIEFYDNWGTYPEVTKSRLNIIAHMPHHPHPNPIKRKGTIIDDFSQSIGRWFPYGAYRDDAAICSFHPTKNLSCYGDGGAICTNDGGVADRLMMLRQHGYKEKYNYEYLGKNSRLDTIQAAVLRVKLRHIDEILELRKDVYKGFKYPKPLDEYEVYTAR